MERLSLEVVMILAVFVSLIMTVVSYLLWDEKGFFIALGITVIILGIIVTSLGVAMIYYSV